MEPISITAFCVAFATWTLVGVAVLQLIQQHNHG